MKRKQKLLLVTNHSYMFYRFRKQLIEALTSEYEVLLASPYQGHENDLRSLGIKLYELKMDRRSINPLKDMKLIHDLKSLLDAADPDVVITFSIKPNVYLGYLCRKKKIAYFTHVQGLGTAFQKPVLKRIASGMYRAGLKDSRGVFFENEANRNYFVEHKIIKPETAIQLSGAGVPLESFPMSSYPDNHPPHLLYLGRIMKEKGMDELLYALRLLRRENYEFVFDYAGFCEDEYQEQLNEIKREGWAVDHGFVEDPVPLYQKADCVILPSWHEGMSNVLLEAAAIGRPLITTDIPGCQEAVDHGETGFLVIMKDGNDLADKLKLFLNLSSDRRKEMGIKGRQKIVKEFSRDDVVRQTIRSIQDRM